MLVMCVYVYNLHTCNTGVIYQDDLFEQDSRGCVKDTVDRPQEGGPSLVVEDDDNTGGRQRRTATKLSFNAPETGKSHQNTKRDKEVCNSERHI